MSGKGRWYIAAFVATAIMATLGVFVREVSPGNEYAVALGRFSIGLMCLILVGAAQGKKAASPPIPSPTRLERDLWRTVFTFFALRKNEEKAAAMSLPLSWMQIGSGVMLPLFVVCYFKAVLSGTLANAAFLLYLGPVVASTLAALWFGEGLNRTSGLLLGGALLGTLFITEFRLPADTHQAESLTFGILSGVFYGLFLLLNNRKAQGDDAGWGGIAAQFGIAAVVMLPITLIAGVHLHWADLPWIVAVGVLHGFGALTLVILALRHLKTVEYGTISYGEPVMAALVGVVLYGESISALQLVGGALVLIAGIARVLVQDIQAAIPTTFEQENL